MIVNNDMLTPSIMPTPSPSPTPTITTHPDVMIVIHGKEKVDSGDTLELYACVFENGVEVEKKVNWKCYTIGFSAEKKSGEDNKVKLHFEEYHSGTFTVTASVEINGVEYSQNRQINVESHVYSIIVSPVSKTELKKMKK